MPLDHPLLDSGFRRSDGQRKYFIVIPAEAGIQDMSDVQTIVALLVTRSFCLGGSKMLIEHHGKRPSIDVSAFIAPTATICGDVTIGKNSQVAFGAVIAAEGGPVVIGTQSIIRENAVIRATPQHPVRIGNYVLVGPHASLMGCTV
jgi:serine acetyltransferase